jgi:hypothetical protein
MLCVYARSSSLNQYKTCEMRYLFEYVLGDKVPTSKSACLGTMFHKTFEIRSLAKKAIQENQSKIIDDNFGELSVDQCRDYKLIHDKSFEYYSKIEQHLKLSKKDYDDVLGWIEFSLSKYSEYDPFNLDIVAAELFFDIEIDKPWAKYKSMINGEDVSGNLRIKGTMDTVIRHSDTVYEMFDYKTGKYRTDFATGKEKDLEYLKKDTQLLLYLIALKTLYPNVDFMLSLFYVNKGGIFTVTADDKMLSDAWQMLEDNYKNISKNYNPKQLDPRHLDYRCKYLCPFSKPSEDDKSISICCNAKNRISKDGFIKFINEKIDVKTIGNYGSGGGRRDIQK